MKQRRCTKYLDFDTPSICFNVGPSLSERWSEFVSTLGAQRFFGVLNTETRSPQKKVRPQEESPPTGGLLFHTDRYSLQPRSEFVIGGEAKGELIGFWINV